MCSETQYIQVNILGHVVLLPFVGGETESEKQARAAIAIQDAKDQTNERTDASNASSNPGDSHSLAPARIDPARPPAPLHD